MTQRATNSRPAAKRATSKVSSVLSEANNLPSIEQVAMQSVLGTAPPPADLHEIQHIMNEVGGFTPECYINRDLSTLRFQLRVLAQAVNPRNPLLERMFF